MVQHGFHNTVATLGTACNLEHLKVLSRYCQILYVLFDGDMAGQKAMLRLTEFAWQVSIDLKIIRLPAGEDPASLLAKEGDLHSLVTQAQDIFMFYIQHLGQDFYQKTLQEKMQSTKNLLSLVAHLEPLKQDFLLQTASKAFAIPFTTLKTELARLGHKTDQPAPTQNVPAQTPSKIEPVSLKKISDLEKKLFSVIVNNIMELPAPIDLSIIESFSSPLQEILTILLKKKEDDASFDFAEFFELLTPVQRELTNKILFTYQTYDDMQSFMQLFEHFTKNQWKTRVNTLKLNLAKAHKEGNEQKVKKLLEDFQHLKRTLTRGTHEQKN